MKINVFSIAKNDPFEAFYHSYIRQCRGLGIILELKDLFPSNISKAQKISPQEAQKSYTQTFLPHLSQHNFALHPLGRTMDSFKFAQLLSGKHEVCFFIGGAYGFEEDFLNKTHNISLSPLTFSHQIAKLILCEQIYRGASINMGHPYHK
ncbi:23S rRNA (pseudouridine(1915)-N(3))-methyltransferase RlmH [Helicobacter pametensis]|uniref:23S rRNA (pseudouridine(1915)-N(3))-methyltransferase RlmH n=1 Tax=Helicobacter pametensis TaxID=95149 RepID=UPI000482D6AF|nr:23S rRNA (pseudouridine(1915)-N(3))-methyltransferase RlmH [Helicobacter pametensis]